VKVTPETAMRMLPQNKEIAGLPTPGLVYLSSVPFSGTEPPDVKPGSGVHDRRLVVFLGVFWGYWARGKKFAFGLCGDRPVGVVSRPRTGGIGLLCLRRSFCCPLREIHALRNASALVLLIVGLKP